MNIRVTCLSCSSSSCCVKESGLCVKTRCWCGEDVKVEEEEDVGEFACTKLRTKLWCFWKRCDRMSVVVAWLPWWCRACWSRRRVRPPRKKEGKKSELIKTEEQNSNWVFMREGRKARLQSTTSDERASCYRLYLYASWQGGEPERERECTWRPTFRLLQSKRVRRREARKKRRKRVG